MVKHHSFSELIHILTLHRESHILKTQVEPRCIVVQPVFLICVIHDVGLKCESTLKKNDALPLFI